MYGGAKVEYNLSFAKERFPETGLFYTLDRLMGSDAIAVATLLITLINIFNTIIYQENVSVFTRPLRLRRTSAIYL